MVVFEFMILSLKRPMGLVTSWIYLVKAFFAIIYQPIASTLDPLLEAFSFYFLERVPFISFRQIQTILFILLIHF